MKQIISVLFIFLSACKVKNEYATLPQHLAIGKWLDLTNDFSEKNLYWPNNPTGFKLDTQLMV